MNKILIIVFLGVCAVAEAQPHKKQTFNISAGAEGLIPQVGFRNTHKFGFGAVVKGEYIFARHASVLASTGYYFLPAKTVGNMKDPDVNALPLKAGLRYYLGNFYGGAEIGAVTMFNYQKSTALLYSFGIGDEVAIKGGNSVDVGLRYERWNTARPLSVISLRISYEFELR